MLPNTPSGGRYRIRGSHIDTPVPPNAITLTIDAADGTARCEHDGRPGLPATPDPLMVTDEHAADVDLWLRMARCGDVVPEVAEHESDVVLDVPQHALERAGGVIRRAIPDAPPPVPA